MDHLGVIPLAMRLQVVQVMQQVDKAHLPTEVQMLLTALELVQAVVVEAKVAVHLAQVVMVKLLSLGLVQE